MATVLILSEKVGIYLVNQIRVVGYRILGLKVSVRMMINLNHNNLRILKDNLIKYDEYLTVSVYIIYIVEWEYY